MLETRLNNSLRQESFVPANSVLQSNRELLCQLESETYSLTENSTEDDSLLVNLVNSDCIACAVAFLHLLDSAAASETVLWSSFEVNVATDSGVEFYRYTKNRQTSLTFRPNVTQIDVQIKDKGQPALRHLLSLQEALEVALDTLRTA